MKLITQPTKITTLKTFKDSNGNQYELRGQKNMKSEKSIFDLKTNYLELYKKGKRDAEFEKIGGKEEIYMNEFNGYFPRAIRKENYAGGKITEAFQSDRELNGYKITYAGDVLSMNGELHVLHTSDNPELAKTKIKLPDALHINGQKPLSPMAKRIVKLLHNV